MDVRPGRRPVLHRKRSTGHRAPTPLALVAVAVATALLGACGGSAAPDEADAGTEQAVASDDSVEAVVTTAAPVGSSAGAPTFDIRTDGFSFENYGNDAGAVNLTSADVVRMFGDVACAGGTGAGCVLSPPAQAWMDQMNETMNGGHCEGMAVLSLLMDAGKVDPNLFGGPTAASLTLTDNEALQREIAFWFATQAVSPTADSAVRSTPIEIVARLKAWFAGDTSSGGYTLGIYKRDMSDGHAITPIGVEETGDGTADILVYDNNYPGEVRRVGVDMQAGTWQYNGATNPNEERALYDGDADTANLELTPLAVRLSPQAAPFDGGGADASTGTVKGTAARGTSVYLDQAAFLAGVAYRIEAVGGGPISGLRTINPRGGLAEDDAAPITVVPADTAFQIVLDASKATGTVAVDTDIVLIGPGMDAGVDGIFMEPGQVDTVVVDPSRQEISYTTTSNESPTLFYGIDGADDSYAFTLGGVELGASGGTVTARLDTAAKRLAASLRGGADATLAFELDKINDTAGDQSFLNDGVVLGAGESIVVAYGDWTGDKDTVDVGIDRDGDGVVDETMEFVDES